MRTRIRALLAATVLAGTGGLVAIAPATATHDPGNPPVVAPIDVTSSIASVPDTVAPPGERVLFPVTLKNSGSLPITGGKVTVALAGDSVPVYSGPTSSSPACRAGDSETVVVCHWNDLLFPGESASFEVVAHTPTTAGVYQTVATASTTNEIEKLENQSNNHSETTTTVLPPDGDFRAGLVEEGDSLDLKLADGRQYKLTVPQGVPGVIVKKLASASGLGKTCGTSTCGNGFILDFVQHPKYKAEDKNNPLRTDRTFGPKKPCNGLGNKDCHQIWYGKSADSGSPGKEPLKLMEDCKGAPITGDQPGSGVADPNPCINQRYKTSSGQAWFDVRLLTTDPLELPPALL